MLNALEPGLFAPSAFSVGGKRYVVAFNSDGSYTLPTTSNLGLNSRPAKPGETVVPSSLANSDTVPLTFNVGGNTGSQTLYTAVHN